MSRTSSTYVSPNLGPTAPWCQQTSTGVFRPPPAMMLNPSVTELARHEGKTASPCFSSSNSDLVGERGLALGTVPTPPYPLGCSIPQGRSSEAVNQLTQAPGRKSSSPPSYPQNHYGNGPAALSLPNTHGLVGGANGDGCRNPVLFPADQIMKMISYSVHREEDTFLAKKESNRVLEKELQHEQELRRETQRRLESLDEKLQTLQGIREAQSELCESLGLAI